MPKPLQTPSRASHFSWLASALLHGALFAAATTITMFPRADVGLAEPDCFEVGSLFVEPPSPEPVAVVLEHISPPRTELPNVAIAAPNSLPPQVQWEESDAVIVLGNPLITAPVLVSAKPERRATARVKAERKGATAVVSSGFRPAQRISGAGAPYPAAARKAGITGTVMVTLALNESGRATAVSITKSSGNADLDEAALQAARTWRFRPATQDDRPVSTKATLPVRFALS